MNERPDTIVSRFLGRASRSPEREAYGAYPNGALKVLGGLTWGDWALQSREVAGALLAQGARSGDRVAIFAGNRPLWPVTDLGAVMAGLVTVGILPDAAPSVVSRILLDSNATVVVVDTLARLKIIRAIQATTLQRFTIVCDDLEPLRTSAAEGLYEWQSWARGGGKALETYVAVRRLLETRLDALAPDDIATIDFANDDVVGVALSHRSLNAAAEAMSDVLQIEITDVLTAFQSFAEAAGRVMGLQVLLHTSCRVALVENAADTFVATVQEQSTVLAGPLRPFTKLASALEMARANGDPADRVIASMLGTRCRIVALIGGVFPAAICADLHAAGVPLQSVYGKAEHLCVCTHRPFADHNFANNFSAGRACVGNEVKLGAFNELLVRRTQQTFSGYINDEVATASAFSEDGAWWRTGDVASMGADGTVRILGRVRDLVLLSSGERVDVSAVEAELASTQLILHAGCFGAGRDYLVAILALRRVAVEKWAHSRGLVAPWTALVQHHVVREELARTIDSVNALRPRNEHVHKFAVTDQEFTVDGGELTVSHSLVREVVESQYRHVINELYES